MRFVDWELLWMCTAVLDGYLQGLFLDNLLDTIVNLAFLVTGYGTCPSAVIFYCHSTVTAACQETLIVHDWEIRKELSNKRER